jgi:hypothetical protein
MPPNNSDVLGSRLPAPLTFINVNGWSISTLSTDLEMLGAVHDCIYALVYEERLKIVGYCIQSSLNFGHKGRYMIQLISYISI